MKKILALNFICEGYGECIQHEYTALPKHVIQGGQHSTLKLLTWQRCLRPVVGVFGSTWHQLQHY